MRPRRKLRNINRKGGEQETEQEHEQEDEHEAEKEAEQEEEQEDKEQEAQMEQAKEDDEDTQGNVELWKKPCPAAATTEVKPAPSPPTGLQDPGPHSCPLPCQRQGGCFPGFPPQGASPRPA